MICKENNCLLKINSITLRKQYFYPHQITVSLYTKKHACSHGGNAHACLEDLP